MNPKAYLRGIVSVKQVDIIESRNDFKVNEAAKLVGPVAELTFFPFDNPIHSLAFSVVKPVDGAIIRGNHYHKLKEEYIFITSGSFKGKFLDITTRESVTLDLQPNDLVHISPLCAHAFVAVDHSSFIEFTPTRLLEWDSYPQEVASTIEEF